MRLFKGVFEVWVVVSMLAVVGCNSSKGTKSAGGETPKPPYVDPFFHPVEPENTTPPPAVTTTTPPSSFTRPGLPTNRIAGGFRLPASTPSPSPSPTPPPANPNPPVNDNTVTPVDITTNTATPVNDNTATLVPCEPPVYTDGRVAVPLVIEAWEHPNFQGVKATFVADNSSMMLSGKISSMKIFKGLNHVKDDRVKFYSDENFHQPIPSMGAGIYPSLGDPYRDNILSFKILRGDTSKRCADVDSSVWPNPIYLIVNVEKNNGLKEDLITDVSDLGLWDLNDNIVEATVYRGPSYEQRELGSYASFCENPAVDGIRCRRIYPTLRNNTNVFSPLDTNISSIYISAWNDLN